MSLWKIAWRSIQHRSLASALTAFSMALGVALVVAVLVIHGIIDRSFKRGAQGYDLIVGAQGSPLDLVLNTVYFLGVPDSTIPYDYYKEIRYGEFQYDVETAIPICMGGNYKGYPVIGTTPELFDLEYAGGKNYAFADGGSFFEKDRYEGKAEVDNVFYTAIIGATVARKAGLQVGDTFRPVHGMDPNQGEEHDPFTVVGILGHTGTPNDRALFVNIEGFFDMHEHDHRADSLLAARSRDGHDAEPPEEEDHDHADEDGDEHGGGESHDHDHNHERRLSAIFVVLSGEHETTAQALPTWINEELDAQAVYPTEQIARLFEGLIGNIQVVLIILAALVVVVAGIGMMVSIYNSMNERRHEIAVMRALGARRVTVMLIILFESILLSLGGGAIGVLLGHGLIGALGPSISEYTGVLVDPLHFQWNELVLIPGLVGLASIVGYLPAVIAYRTDVAKSLGE